MESTRAESGGRTAGSGWAARVGGGADDYLRGREGSENFPVALRLLPADVRVHLGAVYDVARVIDDLGDQAPGDRTALLRDFRADLATIWTDGAGEPLDGRPGELADGGAVEPNAPVLRRLAATVRAKHLSHEPFDDLVEANLVDQEVATYPTYEDLVEYCELSANPVGRIVLEVFEASTPERVELSDRICTALQIIEHCQDVAEDRQAGRIYLPLEDLTRFGVAETDLDALSANEAVRRLVAFEAERAAALLNSGTPLLRQLHGWARLAVRGYVAGGGAALLALRRAGWDVLSATPRARKTDVARQLIAVSRGRRVGS
jgi:squalene synthase HpnC